MDYTRMQQLDSAVAKIMASIPKPTTPTRARTLTEVPSASMLATPPLRTRTMSDVSSPTTPKPRPASLIVSASPPDTPIARRTDSLPAARANTMSAVPIVRPPAPSRAKSEIYISPTAKRNDPQVGFGSDCNFDSLVKHHRFLFRVHTHRRHGGANGNEPLFMGGKFEDEALPEYTNKSVAAATYDDAANHLDWTTRASSPFVSASFSFAWAIWEATKRYKVGIKHDVEIAVIDARAFEGRAYTAAELLQKGTLEERRKDHWKWHRFAMESQDVLIYGHVSPLSVLTSVPLTQLVAHLPSYFLYSPPTSDTEAELAKSFPLSRLVWSGNPTFRIFSQDLSERFLRLKFEDRLVETSVGSVRLALSFLRPWFASRLLDEEENATESVRDLALAIARWPGDWWVRDHPEVIDFIRATTRVVTDEISALQKEHARGEGERVYSALTRMESRADSGHERRAARAERSEDSGYTSDNESRTRFRPASPGAARPRPRSLRALSPSARLSIAESDVTLFDGDSDVVVLNHHGSHLPYTPPATPPCTPPATDVQHPSMAALGSSPLSSVLKEEEEEDDASSVQTEETSAELDVDQGKAKLDAAVYEDLTLVSISLPSLSSDSAESQSTKENSIESEHSIPTPAPPPQPPVVKVDVCVWTDPQVELETVLPVPDHPLHSHALHRARVVDDDDDDIRLTPTSYFVLANLVFGMLLTIVVLSAQPRRYHYVSFT